MISGMQEMYGKDNIYDDFVDEFEYILDNYLSSTNFQIMEIDKKIEKAKTRNYSRITKYIIATIGSAINSKVPFSGGIKPVLEDVYSALIENDIRKNYLPLKSIFEYEHIISNVLLNRKKFKNKTVLGTEYSSNQQPRSKLPRYEENSLE